MVCDRLPAREATANAHSADACGSDVIALLRHDRTRTAIIIQLKVPSDKIWLLDVLSLLLHELMVRNKFDMSC